MVELREKWEVDVPGPWQEVPAAGVTPLIAAEGFGGAEHKAIDWARSVMDDTPFGVPAKEREFRTVANLKPKKYHYEYRLVSLTALKEKVWV